MFQKEDLKTYNSYVDQTFQFSQKISHIQRSTLQDRIELLRISQNKFGDKRRIQIQKYFAPPIFIASYPLVFFYKYPFIATEEGQISEAQA